MQTDMLTVNLTPDLLRELEPFLLAELEKLDERKSEILALLKLTRPSLVTPSPKKMSGSRASHSVENKGLKLEISEILKKTPLLTGSEISAIYLKDRGKRPTKKAIGKLNASVTATLALLHNAGEISRKKDDSRRGFIYWIEQKEGVPHGNNF